MAEQQDLIDERPNPEPDPAPEPQPEPTPEPQPEPEHAAEIARLREENARLTGELTGFQRAQPAAPKPAGERTFEDMTVAELDQQANAFEALIDKGEVTASRGARVLGQIEAIKREKVREAREAAQAPLRNATAKIEDYCEKYPDLKRKGSELLGKVSVELASVVREFGFEPTDIRAQLIAVERVVGGHRLGGGMADFPRKKIPVGGTGGGPAGSAPPSNKVDPVKEVERLYPDQVQFWDRMRYSDAQRADEAPLVLARRARRQRQTA